jgi:DDE superfamily endonuclease
MGALFLPKYKKKARAERAVIVFEDEASFRQSPTLYRTWAPVNSQPKIPTRGQRNTQKIFGAVSLYDQKFVYRHQSEYFNAQTYMTFLEDHILPAYYRRNHRIYLIHDNASYHKKPEVREWFAKNRRRVEFYLLPAYSPEYNAIERV